MPQGLVACGKMLHLELLGSIKEIRACLSACNLMFKVHKKMGLKLATKYAYFPPKFLQTA